MVTLRIDDGMRWGQSNFFMCLADFAFYKVQHCLAYPKPKKLYPLPFLRAHLRFIFFFLCLVKKIRTAVGRYGKPLCAIYREQLVRYRTI